MKKVEIALDDKSIDILKKVEPLHYNSLINYALRLLARDKYYSILIDEEFKRIEKDIEKTPLTKEDKKEDIKKEVIKEEVPIVEDWSF